MKAVPLHGLRRTVHGGHLPVVFFVLRDDVAAIASRRYNGYPVSAGYYG